MTGFEADDEALSLPSTLMATTVNVYVAPLDSPVTAWVVAVELNRIGVWRTWPIHGVTTYATIGAGTGAEAATTPSPGHFLGATPINGGESATQPPNTASATARNTIAPSRRTRNRWPERHPVVRTERIGPASERHIAPPPTLDLLPQRPESAKPSHTPPCVASVHRRNADERSDGAQPIDYEAITPGWGSRQASPLERLATIRENRPPGDRQTECSSRTWGPAHELSSRGTSKGTRHDRARRPSAD